MEFDLKEVTRHKHHSSKLVSRKTGLIFESVKLSNSWTCKLVSLTMGLILIIEWRHQLIKACWNLGLKLKNNSKDFKPQHFLNQVILLIKRTGILQEFSILCTHTAFYVLIPNLASNKTLFQSWINSEFWYLS